MQPSSIGLAAAFALTLAMPGPANAGFIARAPHMIRPAHMIAPAHMIMTNHERQFGRFGARGSRGFSPRPRPSVPVLRLRLCRWTGFLPRYRCGGAQLCGGRAGGQCNDRHAGARRGFFPSGKLRRQHTSENHPHRRASARNAFRKTADRDLREKLAARAFRSALLLTRRRAGARHAVSVWRDCRRFPSRTSGGSCSWWCRRTASRISRPRIA